MTLPELNDCAYSVLHSALLQCCASQGWVDRMIDLRPFADENALLTSADSCWWALNEQEWLAAFSAHPRIGEKKLSAWCSREQNGVDTTSTLLLDQLAEANNSYEQRFPWIFLVNATGKTGPEILGLFQSRLQNEPSTELRVAAAEQAKITRLRLHNMIDR